MVAEGNQGPSSGGDLGTGKQKIPVKLVVASLVAVLVWAVLILLYALFWSTLFSLFQNITVAIVSLFITGIVIGLVWVVWGPKDTWAV